jgi:hypothetical protein
MLEAVMHRLRYVKMNAVEASVESVHRCVIVAQAVCRKDTVYFFPDQDLAEFDFNERQGNYKKSMSL